MATRVHLRPAAMLAASLAIVLVTLALLVYHYHFDSEKIKNVAEALAVLVGGGWTLYLFVLRKAYESALSIDCDIRTEPLGEQFVVFLQATFANIGNRRITAPANLSVAEIEDYEQSVRYPADLQIKAISENIPAPKFAGWWSTQSKVLSGIAAIPEHISLLHEYSRSNGDIDFFMEPGEKYSLGTVFLLPAGHYMAKIVFVGVRASASEFWSRITYFRVPNISHSGN